LAGSCPVSTLVWMSPSYPKRGGQQVAVLVMAEDVGHPVAVDILVVGDIDLEVHSVPERERVALGQRDELDDGTLADDDLHQSDNERPPRSSP